MSVQHRLNYTVTHRLTASRRKLTFDGIVSSKYPAIYRHIG